MEEKFISLMTKPSASLHISILHPQPAEDNPLSDTLVVFLNGLVLPCAAWSEAVEHLINLRNESNAPIPSLLSYDRYGQGMSDSDPTDAQNTPYGHDARTAVTDLHQLLIQVAEDDLNRPLETLRLVLVGNSLGCVLARLYAAQHPGRVKAFIFLDSMMANTDFVSIFPDPDSPQFDPGQQLPDDISADDLRHARAKFREFFHPTVPNSEHLDRRQLAGLLPYADKPALPAGPGGRPPLLVVVGHDWDEFAAQCEKVRLHCLL
jgi:pimeloyl-ACP methyl ester carboxylesterase